MSVSRVSKRRGPLTERPARRPKHQAASAGLEPVKGFAFYDVDGTLVDLNLLHTALFVGANLGEWSGRLRYIVSLTARLPALYRAERNDRRLLNERLFECFKGISRDRLQSLGEEFCERILVPHLYAHARDLIEANRAAGLEPVLVSGSPDFIIQPLAAHLKINDFAANRLVFSGGLATGRLHRPVMAGEEKAEWCAIYASSRGFALDSCWGYADSYYDLPFLAAMGHAVAVNPDRRLAAVARSRQWPVMSFAKSHVPAKRAQTDWQGFSWGTGGE
jgi:HAD superfamily hydrolase (TIGR01490 family)